jgi:integrase
MRGSTEKRVRQKGTVWTARVDLPPDPATGKRRQRRITAATKKELDALVAQAIHDAQRGVTGFADAGRLTVRAYLDQWLETVAPTLRASTVRRYRDLCRKHIDGVIGALLLAKLTTADVQRLYANRLAAGLSPTTVRHVHGVLHRALAQAVEWRLLAANPSATAKPPRRSTPEMQTWAPARSPPSSRPPRTTGSKRSGACSCWAACGAARRWGCAGPTSTSRGAPSRSGAPSAGGATSRLEEGEPKTATGRRQVALPASAVASLRRHRDRQAFERANAGPAYEDRDLAFASPTGGPLHPNSIARRWAAATEAAGLPAIRLHDARHTCASLLLAQGIHPKVVQERLGHADIAMTMDLYSHVVEGMQRAAADSLDAVLDRAAEGAPGSDRDPNVTHG